MIAAGSRLGPYEVLASLGAGGMGEVYRARDTRLSREVAIKVLPAEVASDASRLKRFEKEARSASALNHPNIVTIYDIGSADSISYIAMERVEGKTLRELLFAGSLPIRKLLPIAAQIADGLAKAHEAGIVHRDLKPENVMVTKDGLVKILDFGLAKLTSTMSGSDEGSQLPTETGTSPGMVVGTVGYMSPEQAAGQPVDFRSDQFSFGSILYEMATGKRAFRRKTGVDTLAAILNEEPKPIGQLNAEAPAPLGWLVERCLAKDPDARFASTKDLARDLASLREHVSEVSVSGEMAPVRWKGRTRLLWLLAAAVASLGLALVIARWRVPSIPPQRIQASLLPPDGLIYEPDYAPAALSPDGSRVVFGTFDENRNEALSVRALSQGAAQRLPGTEFTYFPFWSPDSQSIGLFSIDQRKLKTIDVLGGTPKVICDAPDGRGGTWSRDGVILFAPNNNSPIFRVSASGGEPTPVTRLDLSRKDYGHRWPWFLPDGKHFLYQASPSIGSANASIRIGSLDSNETKPFRDAVSSGVYVSPGYVLFVDPRGRLVAQGFDAERLEARGASILITEDAYWNHRTGSASFSASDKGILAYQTLWVSARLTWFDRRGQELGAIGGQPGENQSPRISPDGQKVAIQEAGIWIYELSRGVETRLMPLGEWPVWSPDGRQIVFFNGNLSLKASSGVGDEQRLLHSVTELYPNDWSPDGRFILYEDRSPATLTDLWVLPLDGDRKPRPFLRTEANEAAGRFSPDGRWIAYASSESGAPGGIYVLPFPGPGDRWQVTTGGSQPVWRRDGRELFYLGESEVMAVEVMVEGSTFRTGEPKRLFHWPSGSPFEVSPDGQRFLMAKYNKAIRPDPITLVLNWTAGLKR